MSSVKHLESVKGAPSHVLRLLLRISGLERRDMSKALRLGVAYASILASLYVLKPARNSLFLSRIGPAELPIVMCVVALVGGLTALALAASAGAFSTERLLRWSLPLLAVNLLAWWVGLARAPSGWLVGAFYVWVNVQGQLTTALLWLLAGAALDARQSRRVFAFVGACGIAGAVGGGALTNQLASRVGTVHLLPLCALALLVARAAISRVSVQSSVPRRRRAREHELADVRDSRLLRVLLSMTLLGAMATSIIDFQFNAAVGASLPNEDAKTAFFGSFFAYLNVGAFLFQLAFTSRVMGRFGLGPSLLVLPTALGLGSVLALVAPGLTTATLLKATDASLRHSLYRSAVELLFIPLPARVKQWFRVFLDAAVDNFGTGLGALAVLLLTSNVGVGGGYLALLSLAIIVLWGGTAVAARPAHVDAFRTALEARQFHPEELALDASRGSVTQTVLRALHTMNERQLNYVLDLVLAAAPNSAFAPRLRELVGHPSAEIRSKALRALRPLPDASAGLHLTSLLDDPDGAVRREAAVLLAKAERGREASALSAFLDSGDARRVAAGLGAALELELSELLDVGKMVWLLPLQGEDGEWARRELARVLGLLPASSERQRMLAELARDPSPRVVRQAIRSAGQLKDPELLEFLVERLGDRAVRAPTIEALSGYGASIVPLLCERLSAGPALSVQLNMTRVLARIEDQAAVDCLFLALEGKTDNLRHAALKSLNKLRSRGGALRFSSRAVDIALEAELAHFHGLSTAARVHSMPADAGERLLLRALGEKRQSSLEHVFRLLGLRYPPNDMENAFVAITSKHRRARAQAAEFLENLLTPGDKLRVLPLVDAEERTSSVRVDESVKSRSLASLMRGRDAWIRACAVYCAARRPELRAAIGAARSDSDPIVRETAELVLQPREAAC